MSGKYLLDTNAMIARIAGEAGVIALLQPAEEVFVSSIALGELYYGAENSGRVQENLAQIDRFAAGRAVLSCDQGTARHYGQVMRQLRMKGRPIPTNDIWIAAIALQHHLTLVARDAHFAQVDGLSSVGW